MSQVGVREHGHNGGLEVEKYIRFVGSPAGSAWCSCFVSWCLRQAGILTARFGRARSWFDKRHTIWANGRQVPGRPPPRQGDVVGYRWGSIDIHHTGFLDIWGTGPACQTVEGNTSGGKQSREGDGVYVNWRLKRMVAAVADPVDDPTYTHSE